ncbi:hypothetical protein BJY52DRAFT_1113430 [Lactarius psammicola]|nr:hypothetical protein BJY52DRAFT_1125687 [Lactarius psammicola]KAI9465644.1 hypothetical protein BJY52DRAFT_1113430 [Lactarius psammicola]
MTAGPIEELLIDFCELLEEHSGENMAQAVWETLTQYGLIGQVIVFVMDNTTNNDTLLRTIEKCYDEVNVYFSATESRLCCMPYTVHLAAIKVTSISVKTL